MKKQKLALFSLLSSLALQSQAFAHKNVVLQYTMKNVAKDVALVKEPTTKPAADVLDGMVLNAVIRTRTAAFLLQSANDRKGKIEGGKLVMDEMTPAPIEEEPDLVKAKQMLDAHSGTLTKAKDLLQRTETLLAMELKKEDPTTRDFSAVKKNLDALDPLLLEIYP